MKRPIGSRVGKMTLRRGFPAAGSGGGCGGCPGISFSARRSPHMLQKKKDASEELATFHT